jgi:tripartite-type tricarboxylate transporter receptor subunit TctC
MIWEDFMKLPRRQFLHLAGGAVALPAVSRVAWAQTYPLRPITLNVPFPAGGPTDLVGRILAERMKASLGQAVIVENVSGANGAIGVGRVARAVPDGYTVGLGLWGTHVVNGAVYSLPYDVRNAFEPVGPIVINPLMIFGKKDMPGKDLRDLIAWLTANPDKASLGTTTAGTHALGAMLQKETRTRFQFVPYRGAAPAMQDLASGQIDLVIESAVALPQVRAGYIKAFATLNHTRLALAPDIPTAGESSFPSLTFASWFGLFAPKGTPKELVAKLNGAIVEALDDPSIGQRLAELTLEVFPRDQRTPEALGAIVNADIEKWWPIIKAANIKGE